MGDTNMEQPTTPLTKAMKAHPKKMNGLSTMNRKHSIKLNMVTLYSMSLLLQNHPAIRLRTFNTSSE